jgi:hypothetical protein
MKKYPILLVAWAMWPGLARADLKSTLTSKLSQYCIPKDAEGCGVMRPRYQSGTCYCGNSTYMQYSANLRTCQVKCPAGQIPDISTSGGCDGGYGVLLVKDF